MATTHQTAGSTAVGSIVRIGGAPSVAVVGTTPAADFSSFESLNFDGRRVTVALADCFRALAKYHPQIEGGFKAVRLEQGVLIRMQGGPPYLVTKSGMAYRHSEYGYATGDISCTFDSNGTPLAQDATPLRPCARIIVVGDSHVVCAPPGIHVTTPHTAGESQGEGAHSITEVVTGLAGRALSSLASLFHADDTNNIVAECSWLTKQWIFLHDVKTGGASGPEAGRQRDVLIKASITSKGELRFSENLESSSKKQLFPWEENASHKLVTEKWEFEQLTASAQQLSKGPEFE